MQNCLTALFANHCNCLIYNAAADVECGCAVAHFGDGYCDACCAFAWADGAWRYGENATVARCYAHALNQVCNVNLQRGSACADNVVLLYVFYHNGFADHQYWIVRYNGRCAAAAI